MARQSILTREDARPTVLVAYIETTVRGITSDDPSDLAALSETLRELRARALPEDMSRERMRKALEKWT
jgi:hypothetical protein